MVHLGSREYGWSKTKLSKQIASAAHLEVPLDCKELVCYTEQEEMVQELENKEDKDTFGMPGNIRIIQSIPSHKAEPFKMWLAQVGRERIEESIEFSLAWSSMTTRQYKNLKGLTKENLRAI